MVNAGWKCPYVESKLRRGDRSFWFGDQKKDKQQCSLELRLDISDIGVVRSWPRRICVHVHLLDICHRFPLCLCRDLSLVPLDRASLSLGHDLTLVQPLFRWDYCYLLDPWRCTPTWHLPLSPYIYDRCTRSKSWKHYTGPWRQDHTIQSWTALRWTQSEWWLTQTW